jgi:hypothetical protein
VTYLGIAPVHVDPHTGRQVILRRQLRFAPEFGDAEQRVRNGVVTTASGRVSVSALVPPGGEVTISRSMVIPVQFSFDLSDFTGSLDPADGVFGTNVNATAQIGQITAGGNLIWQGGDTPLAIIAPNSTVRGVVNGGHVEPSININVAVSVTLRSTDAAPQLASGSVILTFFGRKPSRLG